MKNVAALCVTCGGASTYFVPALDGKGLVRACDEHAVPGRAEIIEAAREMLIAEEPAAAVDFLEQTTRLFR